VEGISTPEEMRIFNESEDKFFDVALRNVVVFKKKTVFVEIGSGTGRYLVRCLKKTFTDRTYSTYLSWIVGVDFSLKMIERSVEKIVNSIPEFAASAGVDQRMVEKELIERVTLINADATRPFLQVEGDVLTLVGIMFGTLGNLTPESREAVLHSMRKLIDHGGEGIITVFDAEDRNIGQLTYEAIKNLVGRELRWDESAGAFVTQDKGFYSHWFKEEEFIDLLKKSRFTEILERGRIGERGIAVRISTPRGREAIVKAYRGQARLLLQCPRCSQNLCNLPLPDRWSLRCDTCSTKYQIARKGVFRIPILVKTDEYS